MRIALTYPFCWPHVQRGGERLFADVTRYLVGAEHEVTTISAGPHRVRAREGRLLAIQHRAVGAAWLDRRGVDQPVAYLPFAAWSLRRHPADVVHGLFHLDGVAARLAGRRPYLIHVQGMPSRSVLDRRPVHRRLFPASASRAAAILAVSNASARALETEFGLRARVVHNGVFVDDFRRPPGVARSERPTILFPAAPDDPRKRLDVLVEAIERIGDQWAGLRLAIAAPTSPATAARLRQRLGSAVELLDVSSPSAMPAAYARAWVSCLPAVREAFGLVLIESLAAGTPAVAVRDGGVPEVLTEDRWLAEPDDAASLAVALDHALHDAAETGVEAACVDRARPFDWSARGPALEAVYEEVTAASSR